MELRSHVVEIPVLPLVMFSKPRVSGSSLRSKRMATEVLFAMASLVTVIVGRWLSQWGLPAPGSCFLPGPGPSALRISLHTHLCPAGRQTDSHILQDCTDPYSMAEQSELLDPIWPLTATLNGKKWQGNQWLSCSGNGIVLKVRTLGSNFSLIDVTW